MPLVTGPTQSDAEYHIRLECTEDSHNKFYEITWVNHNTDSSYRIRTLYGGIGEVPRNGKSHLNHSYHSAMLQLEKIIRQKEGRGYVIVEEGLVAGTTTKSKKTAAKDKLADKKKKKSTHRFANLEF